MTGIPHRIVVNADWKEIMPGMEAHIVDGFSVGRLPGAVLEFRFDYDCGCPLRQRHFTEEAHDTATGNA
jgi:hypothetical protein